MLSRRDFMRCGGPAVLMLTSASGAWAQEKKVTLFKVITVKDEIVIGLTADELKALGGSDAGAVAHALAQKGDMTVWQYNVHHGATRGIVRRCRRSLARARQGHWARSQRYRWTLRFSAEVLPRLETSSYSMLCPSFKLVRPAFSTAEM